MLIISSYMVDLEIMRFIHHVGLLDIFRRIGESTSDQLSIVRPGIDYWVVS